jgi:1-acyl-sn-glycerol-3-phosphate acyltransferase
MIYVRSALFNVAFFVVTALTAVFCLPFLIAGRPLLRAAIRLYAQIVLSLLKHLVGIRLEVRGAERLPAGAYVVASKHQSTWETIAYLAIWPDPVFFLKRELLYIPLWGWYVSRLGMVPVARAKGGHGIRKMLEAARRHLPAGRQLIIFPEGTRRKPADPPDYKPGITALCQMLQLTCVPVALNSGCYWPRRSFLKHPGQIVVEILEPIQIGLKRAEFETRLSGRVEAATRRLVAESRQAAHAGEATRPARWDLKGEDVR